MPILLCIVFLVALSTAAVAEVTLNYSGETPTTGMSYYSDGDFSDDMWDYVYDLSDTSSTGPLNWAIVVPYEPAAIYDPDGSGWTGTWYESIESANRDFDPDLEAQPGVVWEWSGDIGATPVTGTFHFQSSFSPVHQDWEAIDGAAYSGEGTEWSASPEPASALLVCIGLFGVGAWRRKSAASD